MLCKLNVSLSLYEKYRQWQSDLQKIIWLIVPKFSLEMWKQLPRRSRSLCRIQKIFPLSKGFHCQRKNEIWKLWNSFPRWRGWALLCDRSALGTSAERSPAATKTNQLYFTNTSGMLHKYFRKSPQILQKVSMNTSLNATKANQLYFTNTSGNAPKILHDHSKYTSQYAPWILHKMFHKYFRKVSKNTAENSPQTLQKMLYKYFRKLSTNTSENSLWILQKILHNMLQVYFRECSINTSENAAWILRKYSMECTVLECLRNLPRPQILKIGVLSLIWGSATHPPQKLTAPIVPILQRTYTEICGNGKYET